MLGLFALAGCGGGGGGGAQGTSSGGSSPPPTTASYSASPFGFLDVPPKNFDYYLDLGAHWLNGGREGYDWNRIENVSGQYDFSEHDQEICNFYQQGQNLKYTIRPINTIYGTRWVEGNLAATDEYPDGYLTNGAAFVQKFAERYDGDGIEDASCSSRIAIRHYQLVHELGPIEMDYWQNHRDQYAEVFAVTYEALKRACADCILYMPVPHISELIQGSDFLNGFSGSNIISGESGMAGTQEMEPDQAGYVIRAYVTNLAYGQKKQLWTSEIEYSQYNDAIIFAHTGLIHNPANSDGLSHKKLAYYSYKKMIEVLEGSDWASIQVVRESDGVYIYRFPKNSRSVYVAWWDYFNDASYAPGTTRQVPLLGLPGSTVLVTEAVPQFASGAGVTDYQSAFRKETLTITSGAATLTLGEKPVFVETQ